jgi:hypothetical protein
MIRGASALARGFLARAGWIAAGALSVLALLLFAGHASGGPLDPPGPPGPTMQSLNQMPPDWVQQLDSTNGGGSGCGSSRFECVMLRVQCTPNCFFTYDGVLDHETGLVWQRNLANYALQSWESAKLNCANYSGGDRRGWRLPTAAELMSLLDSSVVPALPPGHPFINVPASGVFWTTTLDLPSTGNWAWVVRIQAGDAIPASLSTSNGAWCVRAAE